MIDQSNYDAVTEEHSPGLKRERGAAPKQSKLLSILRMISLLVLVVLIIFSILKGPNWGRGAWRGNWIGLAAWGFSIWLLLDTSTRVLFTLYDEPGARGMGLWYWIATLFLGAKVVLLVGPGEEPKAVRPSGPLASFFARLGAPGIVIIDNGAAVVFERSGRFTRVKGPGIAFTKRFEKIARIVDLRPRICQGKIEDVQTRDGWTFDVQIFAFLQVATGFDRKTGKYTYKENDILSLVYGGGHVYINAEEIDPDQRVLGLVEYYLRKVAAQYTIHDITRVKGVQERPRLTRDRLIGAILEQVEAEAQELGIHVTGLDIARIEVPQAVQQIQQAGMHRETLGKIAEGLGDALVTLLSLRAQFGEATPHIVVNLSSILERIAQGFLEIAGPSPEMESLRQVLGGQWGQLPPGRQEESGPPPSL